MSDFVIVTDAACDLSQEQEKKINTDILPLEVTVEDNVYKIHPDFTDIDTKDFYTQIRNGKTATTAQINIVTFEEFFEKFLKQGKDVLYIGFSSKLSGMFNNAVVACRGLSQKYPDRKIEAIDSKAASGGFGLLVYLAAMKKNNGASYDEVKHFVEDNRDHLCHWFTVDDLNHLKRGGRISSTAAFFGSMMGIKPVLHVDDDGYLQPVEKVRGRKVSVDALFNRMKATVINPKGQTVFINHADCEEDAKYLAALVHNEWKIKDVQINYIGPIIGAHTGAATLALFFLGSEK